MIRVGVVGVGHLGKIHLKCWNNVLDAKVVGIYDTDQKVAARVSEEFGVPYEREFETLLGQCDCIDIVTPTTTHYEYIEHAIRAGKHVFVEKPLTATLEEGRRLLKLAGEADVKVQVGHVERFNPAFVAASRYVERPMFIETHRLALFNPRGMDVSVVLDLMIHDLDIVLHLVKSPIKKIHSVGVAVVGETPDIANARIEFLNGCVANLTTSRISMKNMRKTRIFQSNAYISIDFLDKKCEVITMHPVREGEEDPLAMILDLGKKGKRKIVNHQPEVILFNAIEEELKSFIRSVRDNTVVPVTLEDGLAALEVAFQIRDLMHFTSAGDSF